MLRLPLAAATAAATSKRTVASALSVTGVGSRRHICEKLFIGGAYHVLDEKGASSTHMRAHPSLIPCMPHPPLGHTQHTVVPPATTSESLRTFFQSYGPIRDGTRMHPNLSHSMRACIA